jgi:hypothetical protein
MKKFRPVSTSTVPFLFTRTAILPRASCYLGPGETNMKHFRKFRDDRFALTTLQNPLCEVRTRAELIQAAQQALQHQPDAAEIPATPPPVAPQGPPAAVAPLDQTAQPAKPHATEIIVPVRKAAKKFAKRRPPMKATRHSKQVQLAAVVPAGDAAEYVSELFDRQIAKSTAPHRDEDSELATVARHARKCAICHHPDREDLEEDFLAWRNAELIQKDYELPNYRTIYRHARATGLYQRRRENLRFRRRTPHRARRSGQTGRGHHPPRHSDLRTPQRPRRLGRAGQARRLFVSLLGRPRSLGPLGGQRRHARSTTTRARKLSAPNQ